MRFATLKIMKDMKPKNLTDTRKLMAEEAVLIAQQSGVFKTLRPWEQEQAIKYIYMNMIEARDINAAQKDNEVLGSFRR